MIMFYVSLDVCAKHKGMLENIQKVAMTPEHEEYLYKTKGWTEEAIEHEREVIDKHRIVMQYPVNEFFVFDSPVNALGDKGTFIDCVCHKPELNAVYSIKVTKEVKKQLQMYGAERVRKYLEELF